MNRGVQAAAPEQPRQLRRQHSSSASASAVATDEPDAILLRDEAGFVALVRVGRGQFMSSRTAHLGLAQRGGHIVAARRPGGGYALLRMRDEDQGYTAVRTSKEDNEVIVVHTKLGRPAVLVRHGDGKMQPMPQFSGISVDPAVIFGVSEGMGAPTVMYMLVVRKENRGGAKKKGEPRAQPTCMFLQQGRSNIFFQAQQPLPRSLPPTICVQTISEMGWMTLRLDPKSDCYQRVTTTAERPGPGSDHGVVHGQGVRLLRDEYSEILTGRGEAEGPLVSVLRQEAEEADESSFSVMERTNDGVYNLAPFAGEGGAINVV